MSQCPLFKYFFPQMPCAHNIKTSLLHPVIPCLWLLNHCIPHRFVLSLADKDTASVIAGRKLFVCWFYILKLPPRFIKGWMMPVFLLLRIWDHFYSVQEQALSQNLQKFSVLESLVEIGHQAQNNIASSLLIPEGAWLNCIMWEVYVIYLYKWFEILTAKLVFWG